jgi:hypothetical protein
MSSNKVLAPRPYGYDPRNTVNAGIMTACILRSYHGPLTAVAYRDRRGWDFSAGLSSEQKLASYTAATIRERT